MGDFDWSRMSVSKDLPVSELLDHFHDEQKELALIRKNGRTLLLVILTDAIETIMGSAEDPLDLLESRLEC